MNAPLTKDTLCEAPDTSLWRLYLRLRPDALEALLTGPESVGQSVIYRRLGLSSPHQGDCTPLEETVYDNPLLLGDFASVSMIIDTPRFVLLPSEAADTASKVVSFMLPGHDAPSDTVTCPLGAMGELTLAMQIDTRLLNFLRRTFTNPALHHPLTAAGNYLAHRNRTGDPRRSYALLAPDQMLLFGFSADGTLRLANRYGITCAADAAYFIMAATADHTPAAMLIGGDNAMRNEITPLLRTYMDPILPLTISDDLLHLRRMAPEAPVDMLMLTQL